MTDTENLSRKCVKISSGKLKKLGKALSKRDYLQENKLFEKELLGLYRSSGDFSLLYSGRDRLPFVGQGIAELQEITDETVTALLLGISGSIYLTNDEFDGLIMQSRLALIEKALSEADASTSADYIRKMYAVNELDTEKITAAASPLHEILSADEIYTKSSPETQALYRRRLGKIAKATEIDEQRLVFEIKNRAERSGRTMGREIWSDWKKVFPPLNARAYIFFVLGISVLLSASAAVFTAWWLFFIAFFPCLTIVKPLCDIFASRLSQRVGFLPRMGFEGKIPESEKTVCVLSSLVSDEKSIKEALLRLRQAKIRNPSENLYFVLLCDLPAAENETIEADEALLKSLERARAETKTEDAVIIIRRRRFSKTQRKWQGHDRKRGAIEELVRFLCGERADFLRVCGEEEKLVGAKYLAALDFDTVPLMDTLSELVSVAAHPLNEKYGIFAPRISSSLDSTLKTVFSRRMGGVGGVGGISAYDSFSSEFYSDCFGEGIFTGKGLIRVRAFYEKACGVFPEERVLSHDILEGGLLNTIYCGDIEFYDSFPPTSLAYFKRQHRWLRGDFQNIRFMLKRWFTPLTRLKLFDNIARGLSPLFVFALLFLALFVKNGALAVLLAAAVLVVPYLPSLLSSLLNSMGWARRFYSPILSELYQTLSRAFLEVVTLPYSALTSLDAFLKTLWRMLVSRRNLLQWTTSGMLEKSAFGKRFSHIMPSFSAALALLFFAVLKLNPAVMVFALLMTAELPLLTFCDRKTEREKSVIPKKARTELLGVTEKMFDFYRDNINAENNFLPPDNVQFAPVYRVCPRTSPTNIGMYLLSVLCVRELGLIDETEFIARVSVTVNTVKKLEKWHGSLYNWYETDTLNVVSPFVSTVDSGNLVCALVALKEGLKAHGADKPLISDIEALIAETDLTLFYNKQKRLFSIGFDVAESCFSRHHYDLLMSEARMTSYYAIASGQVEKAHWRALGRTMSKCGRFAGPVAWTGTMFEFLMPELLLQSKEGSMSYEAIKYALHCQKRRGSPWGISESAYYAFDRDLNYQYKAHGVQKIGLKAGLDEERVVSPYSSFLTLSLDPLDSIGNLARLERDGAASASYGFFEAVDYTSWRVGGKAVIKSHMAHHMGMSIVGAANALLGNIAGRYFMSDEKMERGSELLEERVIAGERILAIKSENGDFRIPQNEREEFSETNICEPRINALSNGSLTLFTSDCGISCCFFGQKQAVRKTGDLLRRPEGEFYGFAENGSVMPFFSHPLLPASDKCEYTAAFAGDCTEYRLQKRGLELSMNVSIDTAKNVITRRFTVCNKSSEKKPLTLCAYLEPVLANDRDFKAHPMFMDLFTNVRYDKENKLFTAWRKERHNEKVAAMAICFAEDEDLTFCLSREKALSPNKPFSFFTKAAERLNSESSVPSPCVFIKADMPVDAGKTRTATLFTAFAETVEEAKALALDFRAGKTPGEKTGVNPLLRTTLQGRLAVKMLPQLLYGNVRDVRIFSARARCRTDKRALWRYGISGDNPIILFDCSSGLSELKIALLARHALWLCGLAADLVVVCENALQRGQAERLKTEQNVAAFILEKPALERELLDLLFACADFVTDSVSAKFPEHRRELPRFLPLLPCRAGGQELHDGFSGETFVVSESPQPWCNVLANESFGALASNTALGFTWALNSRENKLSPWFNDLMLDNAGEMALIYRKDVFYDLVNGSRAVFSPNTADYYACVRKITAETSVRVYEKAQAKEITVSLLNTGDRDENISLVYYIEPVLGVSPSDGFIRAENRTETSIELKNPLNPFFKEKAVVSCSKPAKFATDRCAFWQGDFSVRENGGIKAVVAVIPLKLPPRGREKIRFILSYGETPQSEPTAVAFPNKITIKTPDESLNALFNVWLPWQVTGGRLWARTGFFQNGGAFGFRDQLQDCLAALYFSPELCRKQLLRSAENQFAEGDVLHWWHELNGERKGVRTRYSDDLLWLPYVMCEYASVTGDKALWNEAVPYALAELLAEGEHEKYVDVSKTDFSESVYLHCKKSMEKGFSLGRNGLLKIGCGDWNDSYNNVGIKGQGESVWLSMFYIVCGQRMAKAARENKDVPYAETLEKRLAELVCSVEENAWDGQYYLRAFYDDGSKMGGNTSDACKIDLLPQAFAVFAELPDTSRCITAVNSAADLLVDTKNNIIKLFAPPFSAARNNQRPGYVMSYPEGVRENGGQYTHAACWLCLACFKLGQDRRAFELLEMLNPAKRSSEIFRNEPYFMTADIYTNPDCCGRGGWSVYTGAAGWYYKCILEGLFGVEISDGRVSFAPKLPPEWDGSALDMNFGGTEIKAVFTNAAGETASVPLDGKPHEITVFF